MGFLKRKGLYLINVMILTESLFYLVGLPFTINLLVTMHWATTTYGTFTLLIMSAPLAMHNKVSLSLLIAITADRLFVRHRLYPTGSPIFRPFAIPSGTNCSIINGRQF